MCMDNDIGADIIHSFFHSSGDSHDRNQLRRMLCKFDGKRSGIDAASRKLAKAGAPSRDPRDYRKNQDILIIVKDLEFACRQAMRSVGEPFHRDPSTGKTWADIGRMPNRLISAAVNGVSIDSLCV